jgi:hypothetical protein
LQYDDLVVWYEHQHHTYSNDSTTLSIVIVATVNFFINIDTLIMCLSIWIGIQFSFKLASNDAKIIRLICWISIVFMGFFYYDDPASSTTTHLFI